MNLLDAIDNNPAGTVESVADPLEFGYRPYGLPATWRRIRARIAGGQPAATWLDSDAVNRDTQLGADGESSNMPEFVSSAVVMAWAIGGMSNSPARLAAQIGEITQDTPGWSSRGQSAEVLSGQGFSIHMLGTLESPFGPLVSNVHNVACPIGDGKVIVVQLAVNSTQAWAEVADAVVLDGDPSWP